MLSGSQKIRERIKTEVPKLPVVRRVIRWLHFGSGEVFFCCVLYGVMRAGQSRGKGTEHRVIL